MHQSERLIELSDCSITVKILRDIIFAVFAGNFLSMKIKSSKFYKTITTKTITMHIELVANDPQK